MFGVLLRPEGPTDGFVGTWTTTIGAGEDVTMLKIDLATDLTSHVLYDHATGPDEIYDGTWRAVNDDLYTTSTQENFTVHIRATRVAGVLGTAYERL